jgi:hypothetical protein
MSISSGYVQAHSPSITDLSYNNSTNTLSVSITHVVSGDPNHYVQSVEVTVNNTQVIDDSYTSQPGDTFVYEYVITANDGASVGVTAICSISGSDSAVLIVGDSISPSIPSYMVVIIISAIGIILTSTIIVIRRKIGFN